MARGSDETLDEAVWSAVEHFCERYTARGKHRISDTQLAALTTVTCAGGAGAMRQLIGERIDRNQQNASAVQSGKGTKPARNEDFWIALRDFLKNQLEQLCDGEAEGDEVCALFMTRLAIQLRYDAVVTGDSQ